MLGRSSVLTTLQSLLLLASASLVHGEEVTPRDVPPQNGAMSAELDDYLELAVVRNAEMSPAGRHVAWKVFRNDFGDDRQDEQLWIGDVDGSSRWQLTRGDESIGDYEWSPDGAWIAFKRGEQVFVIRSNGGEAVQLDIEGVAQTGDLRFAPGGEALYMLGVAEADDWQEAREEAYGSYTVFREEGKYRHIWRQDLSPEMQAQGKAVPLTGGTEFSVTEFEIAPDGSRIAFAAWPTPHLADLLQSRVYSVPAAGGAAQVLADPPGAERSIVWRNDGKRLAFTATAGFPAYADIVTLAGDGSDLQTYTMPDHDARLIRYDAAGLLFEAGVRTRYGRYQFDLDSQTIRPLDDAGYFAGTSTSTDASLRAVVGSASGGLAEVHVEDDSGRRAITSYTDQLNTLWQPRQTLLQWPSFDGLEIEGVLTWPRDYEPGKRYPLFVRTHGGPTGTDRPGLLYAPRSIYLPAVLAARGGGAFVLQTNYRGSAGYGEAFQNTNFRQLGIGPARDIIAGVEELVAQGYVDPTRVGCLGWSQGGHISAMLATYSDLCTAAIMGAGISDWRTYYYNTDITQFTVEYFGATPLEDDDVYELTSPVSYIDRASTPTLIQHGENDARVPIANGFQLRQLLLDRGVESRMVIYAGMGHGPRTPRHLRAISAHALAWFDEYLFGVERADFVRPVEPDEDMGETQMSPEEAEG